MKLSSYFEQLILKQDLSPEEMSEIMHACMTGALNDAQIAAFLVLMRAKGETVSELTAAANVLLRLSHPIKLGTGLVDIVGTGGDGKNTFNVSTISSIVAAGAGAKVAKHGNRSVSGKSGSADLLQEAGIPLDLTDAQLQALMEKHHICFLFAPHFHQTMQQARNARLALGIRSLFNLLGPLINPARVTKQVVGVFAKHWQHPIAQVLANLGSERALVVHSDDGMDEISISATTEVVEFYQGKFSTWTVDPKTYGCYHPSIDAIVVDSPQESLALIKTVLDGGLGPARDIVLLNTASALYCSGVAKTFEEGIQLARESIDSQKAKYLFDQLRTFR